MYIYFVNLNLDFLKIEFSRSGVDVIKILNFNVMKKKVLKNVDLRTKIFLLQLFKSSFSNEKIIEFSSFFLSM